MVSWSHLQASPHLSGTMIKHHVTDTMETRGRMYAVQLDEENACSQLEHVITAVRQEATTQGETPRDTVVIGGPSLDLGKALEEGSTTLSLSPITLSELFIHLWRRHHLHNNERQTVVSAEDQLVMIQLCLADLNKQKCGDFDVEASTVMEMQTQLHNDKMSELTKTINSETNEPIITEEYKEFRSVYNQFLKYCNMTDLYDVVAIIEKELVHNQDLQKDLTGKDYILIGKPQAPIEAEMLKVLANHTSCIQRVAVGIPLEEETGQSQNSEFVEKSDIGINDIDTMFEDVVAPSLSSVTQHYAASVIMAYVQILVNSRSELGLARALNIPDRELDHKAFTALKKDAKKKGLSMFQTGSSFVMRIRMGGKGYAPGAENPLAEYVKGLGQFVDMMHKLQTVIEEDTNCAKAVKRVINIIKNTIVKHRDNTLRPESVEKAAERLQQTAGRVVSALGSDNPLSPQRPAGMGGSMLGRDTIRVLRHLVDSEAGIPLISSSITVLSDITSSQKTPLRFPSLLSKFRSPVELSPEDKVNKSLAERLLEKVVTKPKVMCAMPRYQANYDWAQPVHDISNTLKDTTEYSVQSYSSTVEHPAPEQPKPSVPRRIIESLGDQENLTNDVPTPKQARAQTSKKRSSDSTQAEPVPKKLKQAVAKRPLPSKAGKKQKGLAALGKGQKQLTSFFRM